MASQARAHPTHAACALRFPGTRVHARARAQIHSAVLRSSRHQSGLDWLTFLRGFTSFNGSSLVSGLPGVRPSHHRCLGSMTGSGGSEGDGRASLRWIKRFSFLFKLFPPPPSTFSARQGLLAVPDNYLACVVPSRQLGVTPPPQLPVSIFNESGRTVGGSERSRTV